MSQTHREALAEKLLLAMSDTEARGCAELLLLAGVPRTRSAVQSARVALGDLVNRGLARRLGGASPATFLAVPAPEAGPEEHVWLSDLDAVLTFKTSTSRGASASGNRTTVVATAKLGPSWANGASVPGWSTDLSAYQVGRGGVSEAIRRGTERMSAIILAMVPSFRKRVSLQTETSEGDSCLQAPGWYPLGSLRSPSLCEWNARMKHKALCDFFGTCPRIPECPLPENLPVFCRRRGDCAISRLRLAPVTGSITTGPGYREAGDCEGIYLAPRYYDACPRAEDWYDSALGLSDILRATVPSALLRDRPAVRGTFTITVTFQPDPYTDEPTCVTPHWRDECDAPYRDEDDAPPAPTDPCPVQPGKPCNMGAA